MKNFLCAVIFAVSILFLLTSISVAFPAAKHDKYLDCVLFGPPCKVPSSDRAETAMERLYAASYLTIDQFTPGKAPAQGATDLKYLKTQKIKWLPRNINSIDLRTDPNKHRSFTHRGWNWTYIIDEANWPARKMILLSTVNDTFKFGITGNNPENYKGKCDSFAALVYYVHLIGDHIANKKFKEEGFEMNLGGTRDGINIIEELEHHLEILFADQKSKGTYSNLMNRLDKLNAQMFSLVTKKGGIDPVADFDEYHDCAVELMKILEQHIPYLLRSEEFFKKVFFD